MSDQYSYQSGQQRPQQGGYGGQQGGYGGPQGSYPGPQGGYGGQQGGYPQAPGQASSYYQGNQGYGGPPPSQYPNGSGQSGSRGANGDDDGTRGITDKLSNLMHPGSNNSNAPPPSSGIDPKHGQWPFSIFCAPNNPDTITLVVADGGESRDCLVGINHQKVHPAYEILYDEQGDFKFNRFDIPDCDPKQGKGKFAGRVELKNNPDDPAVTEFKFPWMDWSINVETQYFISYQGLLEGKNYMKCVLLDALNTYKTSKFCVRLFDTSVPTYPTVATFYVDDCKTDNTIGKLDIVARLIRTPEQLDEIVVVMFTIMSYHKRNIKENLDDE